MNRFAVLASTFLAFGSLTVGAQENVLVEYGSPMKHLDNASSPGVGLAWIDEGFDDTGWSTGLYGVGYETGSGAHNLLQTHVPAGAYSVYTRAVFNITEVASVQTLFVGADYDDGYVAWINGVEIFRSPQMPAGAPGWSENATLHESSNGTTPDYGAMVDISQIAIPVLHDGDNMLAVGVWNRNAPSSSDLVLVPKLVMNKTAEITRGPYLQMGNSTSVAVRWRTDTPTDSRVRFGESPWDLSMTETDPSSTTEHIVALAGLTPDTRYYYTVGSTAGDLTREFSDHFVVTAPPTSLAKPTRIWVLGDSGTANADARAVRDAYIGFTGTRHTDLWLMLGDNAYPNGTDDEYQAAVFDTYPDMLRQSVLWPTLGNHDGHTADSATQSGPYYDIFSLPTAAEAGGVASGTEAYYSFDYGNIHFVCLDSYETDRASEGAMMTWLQQDLLDTVQDWIIAFWHHPPYSKGSHNSDTETNLIQMRENANPILEANGVDLVLAGHSHSYERSYLIDGHYGLSTTFGEPHTIDGGSGSADGDGPYTKPAIGPDPYEGAVYAVSGSSGKTSGGALDHPAMYIGLNVLGSLVLDVSGNRLDARFLDEAGAVRDSFTIVKDPTVLPVADFAASPTSGISPLTATFKDRSINGVVAWSWDFEHDGTADSGQQNPTHEYAEPGLYSVELTVTNLGGVGQEVKSGYVCVASPHVLSAVGGLNFEADGTTLTWQAHPQGTSYDVVNGDLSQLVSSGGDFGLSLLECVEDDGTEAADPDLPAEGRGFYYLVRAVDCAGVEGTYDTGHPGQTGSRDAEIQGSPPSCP